MNAEPYCSRFAPSPTGPLHAGSLLAALLGWLDARAASGRWLVRIEDLDRPREVAGARDAILRTLEAHGLLWDGELVHQSLRDEIYAAAAERLAARGLLFRCTCTRRRLRELGGVYDGRCRHRGMAPLDVAHAVRARVPDRRVSFEDRLQGHQSQDLAHDVGDFVIRRRDGLWAYQLAVVVDDAQQGVTDVVRGVDLIDSTPRQIWLQEMLELPRPRYMHLPIIVDDRGVKLSKQTGAAAVDDARAGDNLARLLAAVGLPDAGPGAPPAEHLQQALAAWRLDTLPRGHLVLPQ